MSDRGYQEPTGWTGWSAFAAVMLALAGGFGIIAGFVALFRDTVYLVTKDQMIVSVDYTTWGWVHLIMGTLLLVAAASLLQGHMYGRVVAVIVACLSALVNLAFLPAYPIWCTIVIAIDVLVIYAVTAHGRELQA
jgi:hypothetical protein